MIISFSVLLDNEMSIQIIYNPVDKSFEYIYWYILYAWNLTGHRELKRGILFNLANGLLMIYMESGLF